MTVKGNDSWPVKALLAVGAWLVVSPLGLSTTRVTSGVVSAVAGGLALVALAGRRRASASPDGMVARHGHVVAFDANLLRLINQALRAVGTI